MFKQEGWQAVNNRELRLIHLNINSLLPKIEELRYKVRRRKASVISIFESKLDSTVLDPEFYIEYYEILCFDRNQHGRDVAC